MRTTILISFILALTHFGYCQHLSQVQFEPSGNFDGIYLGLNIGLQNVFGGSFVNNMDILAQESKLVTEMSGGYRKQFLSNRVVTGLEISVGFLDGNLQHISDDESLRINYDNNTQISFGLSSGILFGKNRRYLLYGYLNETKRKFDVTIDQPPYLFTQSDKQGMLKYGVGLEFRATDHFHLKTTFGSLKVDFGDLETNIDVEDKYDMTFGIIYQFQ